MQQRGAGLGRRNEPFPEANYEAESDGDRQAFRGGSRHRKGERSESLIKYALILHVHVYQMHICFAGQVLFSDDGLAILEGLNNDAPVGASLRFVSGASGWVHVHLNIYAWPSLQVNTKSQYLSPL